MLLPFREQSQAVAFPSPWPGQSQIHLRITPVLFSPGGPSVEKPPVFPKEKSKHPLLMPFTANIFIMNHVFLHRTMGVSQSIWGLVLAPEGTAAWSVPSLHTRTTAKQMLDGIISTTNHSPLRIQIFKLNKFSGNTFPALITMLRAGHEGVLLSLFRLLLQNTMTGRLRHNRSVLLAVLVAGSLGSGCQP